MGKTLREKIEYRLAMTGMEQKELARKMGMSPQGVWQLKKSIRPRMATIHRLAKAFEVPVDVFMD